MISSPIRPNSPSLVGCLPTSVGEFGVKLTETDWTPHQTVSNARNPNEENELLILFPAFSSSCFNKAIRFAKSCASSSASVVTDRPPWDGYTVAIEWPPKSLWKSAKFRKWVSKWEKRLAKSLLKVPYCFNYKRIALGRLSPFTEWTMETNETTSHRTCFTTSIL